MWVELIRVIAQEFLVLFRKHFVDGRTLASASALLIYGGSILSASEYFLSLPHCHQSITDHRLVWAYSEILIPHNDLPFFLITIIS